ncbi:MAG: hypothetical protein EXR27_17950 [Betaproteobacteria bacterium]|nr:hypothetical protein [Betaproteobacteria bacterium]
MDLSAATESAIVERTSHFWLKAMTDAVSDLDLCLSAPGTIGGGYMRRFWHAVYRAEDLRAGQAKPVRIMSEDFTLYRGESGAVHAVGFRCAHRGAQMSIGFIEGDAIRCFYHGWKYEPSGLCVERPGGFPDERRQFRIRSYPAEEYLGLIFVWFGEGEPPPLPRYPLMEQEGVLDITADVLPCNYFFSLENDAFHFAFTHRDLLASKKLSGVPKVWAKESDWGITCYDQWPNRDSVGVSQKGMPNVGYIVPAAILLAKGTRFALHVSWRVPIDEESHATFRANLTTVTGEEAKQLLAARPANYNDRSVIGRYGEAILAGKMRLEDVADRTHIEFIQDYIAQVGQGGIETRLHEELDAPDAAAVLFRKIWKRELTALAEGRPLKEWRLSDTIQPPIGTV